MINQTFTIDKQKELEEANTELEQKDKEIEGSRTAYLDDIGRANRLIGDLQRLAERALLCLSEHWDELTDENGYGYSSLESALKKAASGKEYKDLSKLSDILIKENQKHQARNEKLELAINKVLSISGCDNKLFIAIREMEETLNQLEDV